MATTFKNMQDDVKDIVQELQGVADFSTTRIKRMLNRGYRNFVKDTDCILDVFSFTTVANQVLYDSSDVANFAYAYKIVSVKYITDATNEFGKVLQPYPGGHGRLPEDKSFGEPCWYYTRGISTNGMKKIGTYPIIDVANETLEVQAYRSPISDLSADADEPTIDDEYRDALVYYAVWRLFHSYSHRNPAFRAKAIEHKQLYDEVVEEFKFNNFQDDLGTQQVTDVYEQY